MINPDVILDKNPMFSPSVKKPGRFTLMCKENVVKVNKCPCGHRDIFPRLFVVLIRVGIKIYKWLSKYFLKMTGLLRCPDG